MFFQKSTAKKWLVIWDNEQHKHSSKGDLFQPTKESCLTFKTRNKKQARLQMGTSDFLVGMMQRHREVHEQTFLKYVRGVLGWRPWDRNSLEPTSPHPGQMLPCFILLNCLPFVTLEMRDCWYMETLDSLFQGTLIFMVGNVCLLSLVSKCSSAA